MTAISTILGAILFLRFGWAVGNVGFVGVLGIIAIGHLVTIPTALAVAEIATNQKVQGGGAYYIISRSFGFNIGGAIGITLYLSQAISVAFYIIAFAEAFDPLLDFLNNTYGLGWEVNSRLISIPTMALLSVLVLSKGANMGMNLLYVVVAILFVSIGSFLFGSPIIGPEEVNFYATAQNPKGFFQVFIIVFPAFTGLAAGLGLSGDLKDPTTSIPKGTLWATLGGMVVYILVAYKMVTSATPDDLAGDYLIMQRISAWGPLIPIGLAAASLSSALGSILVAPRTLQAIGYDKIFPGFKLNKWFSKGKEKDNEPVNATVLTIIIAFFFIAIGDVDAVAQIISMFFMVTYGAICLISFLEHFAADPSYRPTFKSKWYFSIMGAALSFWLMFKMHTPYAAASIVIMAMIYMIITKYSSDKRGLEKLFRGVVFQLSRQLQVFAQRADKEDLDKHWRPFAICISEDSFKRRSAFDVLRWISYKYGFGTYIHYINGFLNRDTSEESKNVLKRLINLAAGSKNRVYLDTIISPSYTSAIAQVIQLSGISGKGNNMILFEFSHNNPDSLKEALSTYSLLNSTEFDICILKTAYKGFGYKKQIHIWITQKDYENANLMILLAYIILGHPEWKRGYIKIFALFNKEELEHKRVELMDLIKSGRLPISKSNIALIPQNPDENVEEIVNRYSVDADFTIIGFNSDLIESEGVDMFRGYDDLSNILYVSAHKKKEIN